MNTIFAQASAPGKAGVSVFRISGPTALQSLTRLDCQTNPKFEPRKLYFRKIYNPKNNQQIDDALVVFFKGTSSFTGEDSVEIYTHGSIAVIKMMHQVLASLEDVRIAEPGEFAKRAFLNGKMDLLTAEGIDNIIKANLRI